MSLYTISPTVSKTLIPCLLIPHLFPSTPSTSVWLNIYPSSIDTPLSTAFSVKSELEICACNLYLRINLPLTSNVWFTRTSDLRVHISSEDSAKFLLYCNLSMGFVTLYGRAQQCRESSTCLEHIPSYQLLYSALNIEHIVVLNNAPSIDLYFNETLS